uniref:Titin n=1 Tax=Sinocyclocheilus anshuiensis TaxID=1608454 RepID=A0A671KLN0_9TELE
MKTVTNLTFKVTGLLENHRYEFRVYAENAAGVSEASSATVFYKALDPVFKPGPPLNPKVLDMTKSSVVLAWGKPIYDGGCEIQGYIVEACVAKAAIEDIKIPGEEGKAVADEWTMCTPPAGVKLTRLPADITDPLKVSEVPQCPGKLSVVDVTKTSVSLSWEKPVHDGGSRILQYLVEMQVKGSDKWSGCANVKTLEAVISHLIPGEEYTFKIIAINEKGKSDPRTLAVPVQAKDLVFGPDVRPAFSNYSVLVGKDLQVEIPVSGRPKPKVTWTKDGAALKFTTRVNISNTAHSTVLSIKEAAREDGGMYGMNVSNAVGQKDATIEIITLDKPGPPTGPVRFDEITVSKYDGGSVITGYTVEKRDLPEGRWMKASFTNVIETNFTVTGLTEGAKYDFRVIAKNAVGTISKPSYNSGPIAALDEVEPPKFSIDPEYTQTLIVNAGDTFKLDADVHGKPLPAIQWFKNDKELENTIRFGTISKPSYNSGPIAALDEVEPPKFSIDPEYTQTLIVNAGDTFKLDADVHGKPL